MTLLENAPVLSAQTSSVKPEHRQVRKAGPLARVKWALLRALLSTVGRASKGIRIGYSFGFDSGMMLGLCL